MRRWSESESESGEVITGWGGVDAAMGEVGAAISVAAPRDRLRQEAKC